jgi:hypothetical protein
MGVTAALNGLLPNIAGPDISCRRLYAGVIRSMALYGAPVWTYSLKSRNNALLRKPQRVMATRMIRGYRTISGEATCLLAGTVPWDLEAKALASVYCWSKEAQCLGNLPAPREVEAHRAHAGTAAIAE